MKLSLRQRILLPIAAILAVTTALLSGIAYRNSRETVTRLLASQTEELCRSTVLSLAEWTQTQLMDTQSWSRQKLVQAATQDTFVGKAARKSANAELGRLAQGREYCESIHLVDMSGHVIASSDADQVGRLDVSATDYFQKAVKGETVISDAFASQVSRQPVLAIVAPVQDGDTVVGVMLNTVKLSTFSAKFIDPVKLLDRGFAFLYSKRGLLLAHPEKSQVLKTDLAQLDWGRALLAKESGTVNGTFDGIEQSITFKAAGRLPWGIAVAVPVNELLAPARRLGYLNLVCGGVSLIAGILVVLMVLRSITGR